MFQVHFRFKAINPGVSLCFRIVFIWWTRKKRIKKKKSYLIHLLAVPPVSYTERWIPLGQIKTHTCLVVNSEQFNEAYTLLL